MRKINEVLRLNWEKGLSARQIAKSCDIARSTVKDYLDRAQIKGLTWPLPADLDDAAVERLLFPPAAHIETDKRVMPSMEYLHQELKKKRVTLQLLWSEYKKANPDGYQYSQFCERYRQWTGKLDVCLRQTYRAGEKLFVDYVGQTIPVTDSVSGKTREAYLFVATLGASNYTFAWAGKNGPQTETLISRIIESRRHPEQGFRSCLGVMRLAKHYSAERLEAACARALILNACSYKYIKSILEKGLDKQPLLPALDSVKPVLHYNLRGKEYYRQQQGVVHA